MIVGSTTMTRFQTNPAVPLARPRADARVRREVGLHVRPYEVMIILDAGLEEESIRSAVDRATELIEARYGAWSLPAPDGSIEAFIPAALRLRLAN